MNRVGNSTLWMKSCIAPAIERGYRSAIDCSGSKVSPEIAALPGGVMCANPYPTLWIEVNAIRAGTGLSKVRFWGVSVMRKTLPPHEEKPIYVERALKIAGFLPDFSRILPCGGLISAQNLCRLGGEAPLKKSLQCFQCLRFRLSKH